MNLYIIIYRYIFIFTCFSKDVSVYTFNAYYVNIYSFFHTFIHLYIYSNIYFYTFFIFFTQAHQTEKKLITVSYLIEQKSLKALWRQSALLESGLPGWRILHFAWCPLLVFQNPSWSPFYFDTLCINTRDGLPLVHLFRHSFAIVTCFPRVQEVT